MQESLPWERIFEVPPKSGSLHGPTPPFLHTQKILPLTNC